MLSKFSKSQTKSPKSSSAINSLPTLNSPTSTATKVPSQLLEVSEELRDSKLVTQIISIFFDSQHNIVTHRKLAIKLLKIHEACCYEATNDPKKLYSVQGFDENDFNTEFLRCILHVMTVKKSEAAGDRVILFVGLFLKLANENNVIKTRSEKDGKIKIETPYMRLISSLIDLILQLTTAKDKLVRYRSTQLVSCIINSLDTIDEELFQLLQQNLRMRIYDKEAIVRAQAVLGLGRLAGNDLDIEIEDCNFNDDSESSLQKLCSVLQNDPSADVRRSLLTNLPILPNTLPYLLERARDQDSRTRRALYSRLLPALGDFRHLSLSMREKILRWGMRDRDENVRRAAHKLFRERWIEDCASSIVSNGDKNTQANLVSNHPNFEALLELLKRIDVVNSGIESGIALEAMKGFWNGRPDYTDEVVFDENFWNTLTAESVFMARTFNDYCKTSESSRYKAIIEEKIPEVTKFASYLQKYIQVIVDAIKKLSHFESSANKEEEDTIEQEFIVNQLLHIAKTLDYSDEVGRRKMCTLLRQSLSIPELPEEVTKLVVEVLRSIYVRNAAGEREFCSVVLEAVADVHDTITDDMVLGNNEEFFDSAKSEASSNIRSDDMRETEDVEQNRAIREILINIKCLHIVQCMLEHVEGRLQHNPNLITMLNNLVVPAVRSHESPVRERGLVCLGLCSLLDKSLAEENMTLFMYFFTKGHPDLQLTSIQILTDIIVTHGVHLLDSNPLLAKIYSKALKSSNMTPEVQAVATIAIAKILLIRNVSDMSSTVNEFLRMLIVIYFCPSTSHNQSVRQTLSYFIPFYAYSCKENQNRIRMVALDALHKLLETREILNDDDDEVELEMVSLTTIGAHLVDWTDPRKCHTNCNRENTNEENSKKKNIDGDVHLEFAKDIIERLSSSISREEKKILASLLAKLYISPGSNAALLRETYAIASKAIDEKLFSDATGRNGLIKIHISLSKIVGSIKVSESCEDLACSVNSQKSNECAVQEKNLEKHLQPSIEEPEDSGEESDEFDIDMGCEKSNVRNSHEADKSP